MTGRVDKVLLLDGVDPVCGRILTQAGISVTTHNKKLSKDQLIKELSEHEGVIVRSATRVTEEVLASSNKLRIIGRAGAGVDNIDVSAATRKGVIVMNTPGGNTLSAAEHTCAMVCSLARFLPQACAALKAGTWDRKAYLGSELHGKTIAIVGLGRIGREVAKRMQAFGMTTIGYDPIIPKEVTSEWGVESLPLEDLWSQADYITVHTPLLPHTKNLIGDEVLAKCKPGVRIVNVARGGIVDEAALLRALENGTCGGAALDVFLEEPPTDLTLCRHPKVICTPHLGANTVEAQRRVAKEIAQQIVDMVHGRPLVGVVNAPALSNATSNACKPWIELAKALGCLANSSEVSEMKSFLGSAVLVGLLKGLTQNGINLVNAPVLAQEVGVSLTLHAHGNQPAPVPSTGPEALQVKVTRGPTTHVLLGNASGGQATLYALDGCVWESGLTLGRNMLFFSASPSATPLAAIATQLLAVQAVVTSLLSSNSTTKEVWHVARTSANVDLPFAIPDTNLRAQLTF
ncbi:D-3-phosphoglycerate dehydrogenase-like [Homarus americanus]|uniref:D-3-phosphoglycerate dehydrogenase n=1 Tax=Homarus americanus TaxID=6706 RepID=A0A8J5MWR3_HOMAM|nr:D-3-phosphoglycerate dehydrogenase-like [Homarus americanus]